jgi:hypothetical protein
MSSASPSTGNGAAPGPLSEAAIRFFNEENWPYMPIESEPILRVPFRGEHGQWMCYSQAREEQQQFVFYSVCPAAVPDARRADMAEFITRANYGLILGNFEMDFGDGELRYKTSIDVEGDELTTPLIRSLVYANVAMMDQYLPGILAVLYGGAAPADAIAQVES